MDNGFNGQDGCGYGYDEDDRPVSDPVSHELLGRSPAKQSCQEVKFLAVGPPVQRQRHCLSHVLVLVLVLLLPVASGLFAS